MNKFIKMIALLGLLAFATTAISAPAAKPKLKLKNWTLEQVCITIAADGEVMATMYKDGLDKTAVKNTMAKRLKKFPEMDFVDPGLEKILGVLEMIKKEKPQVMKIEGFAESIGFAAFSACMSSLSKGWIKNVPGRAFIIKQKPKQKEFSI